jgi:hypothetical protein
LVGTFPREISLLSNLEELNIRKYTCMRKVEPLGFEGDIGIENVAHGFDCFLLCLCNLSQATTECMVQSHRNLAT